MPRSKELLATFAKEVVNFKLLFAILSSLIRVSIVVSGFILKIINNVEKCGT